MAFELPPRATGQARGGRHGPGRPTLPPGPARVRQHGHRARTPVDDPTARLTRRDHVSAASPSGGARVVVTGATGNVGTSVVQALSDDDGVASVLGIARRRPAWQLPKVAWAEADVVSSDLVPLFRGA